MLDPTTWTSADDQKYDRLGSRYRKIWRLPDPHTQKAIRRLALGVRPPAAGAGFQMKTQERYERLAIVALSSQRRLGPANSGDVQAEAQRWLQDARSHVDHPLEITGSLGRARAYVDLFAARVQVGIDAGYLSELKRLREVASAVEHDWDAFERADVPDSNLHFMGFLYHEIGNILAVAGKEEAFDFADRSEHCYRAIGGRSDEKRIARLGLFRALVLRQQASVLCDMKRDRVQGRGELLSATELRRHADLGSGLVDYYGLAKSFHFEALSSWFAGNYSLAVQSAEESLRCAGEIHPHAWKSASEKLASVGWLRLGFESVRVRSISKNPPLLWLLRDSGSYGRAWWLAHSTATLADILACRGRLQQDADDMARAAVLYAKNDAVRAAARQGIYLPFDSINRMPPARGTYRWLLADPARGPNPMEALSAYVANVEAYLMEAKLLADRVPVAYEQVLVRLAWSYWVGEVLQRPDPAARDELMRVAEQANVKSLRDYARREDAIYAPPVYS